jgi:hypothetical protein
MKFHGLAAAALFVVIGPTTAQDVGDGFLCCNMRSDGKWISDINYEESGKTIIPVGTPVKVTGYGRQRVLIEVEGGKQAIGNDYSRTLRLEDFARRYVVAEDPRPKIAAFPPKIRDAIRSARVTPGMSREQVLMAVGYPVTSENPHLDAPIWRMWLWSFSEFELHFDGDRLREVKTDPDTRAKVYMP